VRARYLVTCAGLFADVVARATGGSAQPQIVPIRGEWRKYRAEHRHKVSGLVYPVPDPRFPFLGVHFTLTTGGDVLFGPNAVLSLAREGYRPTDISLPDVGAMATSPALWRLALREWQTGLGEIARSFSTRRYVRLLKDYIPEIDESHLEPDKLAGVRAMALTPDGKLMDDFSFGQSPGWENVLHVRNAPSPAATSSLAIAQRVADMAEKSFSDLYKHDDLS
jgi:(S)-2-hydroxyglutarate dehydrogenase